MPPPLLPLLLLLLACAAVTTVGSTTRHHAATGDDESDAMGARQRLLMAAYDHTARAAGPIESCSLAEVESWMYSLSAQSNETEVATVLSDLAALPTRCPKFLLPMASGFAGSSSCALMRVYQLASNATPTPLPLASKRVIARALLNMTADPSAGSLWAFVHRREDDAMEIDDSENLDLANKMPVSLALEIIESLPGPEFGPDLRLPDGHSVAEHRAAWSRYWSAYFSSRALYGINVETSSTSYSKYFMEELACMHDLTLSSSLRALVSDYMQVYFADAATEYISALGVRGGAKSRVYHDYYSLNDNDPLGEVGWLLGWIGNSSSSSSFANATYGYYYVHLAATSWRPLPHLVAIAKSNGVTGNTVTSGSSRATAAVAPFVYASHRLGRAADVGGDAGHQSPNGHPLAVCNRDGGPRGAMKAGICYFLNITQPSLLRQTYIAPEFMLGTLTFDPSSYYAAISTQNNLMGAVFSGSTADRLVFGGTGTIESGKHGGYPLGTEFRSLSAVQVGPAAVLQRPLQADSSNGSYVFISGALPHRGRPAPPGLGLLPSLRRTSKGWWCFHDTNGGRNASSSSGQNSNNNAAAGAYGCVRLVGNEAAGATANLTIGPHDASDSCGGILLLPRANMWSPLILQLGRAAEYNSSFAAFVAAVTKLPLSWEPASVREKTARVLWVSLMIFVPSLSCQIMIVSHMKTMKTQKTAVFCSFRVTCASSLSTAARLRRGRIPAASRWSMVAPFLWPPVTAGVVALRALRMVGRIYEAVAAVAR